jgi:Tol biopolymer transport system component
MRISILVAIAGLLGLAGLATSMSESGDAAFPGVNGKIAYSSGDSYSYSSAAIWSANADGGSPSVLTSGSGVSTPSYSPDGSQIAFDRESGVAVMTGTGLGLKQLLAGSDSQSFQTEWQKNGSPRLSVVRFL